MKAVSETWPAGAWRRSQKHDLSVHEGDIRNTTYRCMKAVSETLPSGAWRRYQKQDLPVHKDSVRNMTYRCMKAVSETWPTGARRRCQVGVVVARRAQPRVLITSLTPAWWRASLRALVSVKTVYATWNTAVFSTQFCTTQSHWWNGTRTKDFRSASERIQGGFTPLCTNSVM